MFHDGHLDRIIKVFGQAKKKRPKIDLRIGVMARIDIVHVHRVSCMIKSPIMNRWTVP